jgi:hypothetical protein
VFPGVYLRRDIHIRDLKESSLTINILFEEYFNGLLVGVRKK